MVEDGKTTVKLAAMAWALTATVFLMGSLGPIGFDGRPFSGDVAAPTAPARLAGYLA